MKTKTINLYEYNELSNEAKKQALSNWKENNDPSHAVKVELDNRIEELLEKHSIKPKRDIKGYSTKYAKIYFSLGYCQGDGVMFEGVFEWNGYTVTVKHSGRYYHENSKVITIEDEEGNEIDYNEPEKKFDEIYVSICKELEKLGYSVLELEQSEQAFIEACNENEYTFREDGTMEN